ncbi:MAG: FAD assembly factor SdhE [Burkholderiales bacterium]
MSAIRWRSRRGMLELDIVLAKFLDRHETGLSEDEAKAYLALLEYPDAELWDIIMGKGEPEEVEKTLLELIRMN